MQATRLVADSWYKCQHSNYGIHSPIHRHPAVLYNVCSSRNCILIFRRNFQTSSVLQNRIRSSSKPLVLNCSRTDSKFVLRCYSWASQQTACRRCCHSSMKICCRRCHLQAYNLGHFIQSNSSDYHSFFGCQTD